MSIFQPLTLGYDWEVWALNHQTQPADKTKVEKIADRIYEELAPIEGHKEWHFIEMGPGITGSWQELVDRTDRYIEWVQAEFAKEDLYFYPCGTIPAEQGAAGLHVHVGTAGDANAEARTVNAFVRYIPALIALMANSPVYYWQSRRLKAYRMGAGHYGSGGVYAVTPPHLLNSMWWGDAAFRRGEKPTIEVRLADSCMSPKLICEYAVVVAGLLDWIGSHLDDQPETYTPAEYDEFLVNRWQAAKHGLQATFTSGGRETGAPETIRDIIDKAAPGMRKLGASVEDLIVIPKMLAKRQTQADFQLAYLPQFSDLITFTHAFAEVVKDMSAFEQYLDMAGELPLVAQSDLDEEILEKIGRDTRVNGLTNGPAMPPVLLEQRLRRLESQGKLTLCFTPEDGLRCTRTTTRAKTRTTAPK